MNGGKSTMDNSTDSARLLTAVRFAAEKHRLQRRKDGETPYINHPLQVAELLATLGGVTDVAILQAAVLHDTIEDTATTAVELEANFGADVRKFVEEVTDDKSLPKARRKELQVEHAPHLSRGAKQIKLADKICNISDMGRCKPYGWSNERVLEYFKWAERVAAGLRGANAALEQRFDQVVAESRQAVQQCKD
jgi:guanosine-3',5'-bis(diphosphate) 3'-pyrophosphohydrolase